MNTKLPGLVVEVEARINKLEKGLARANRAQRSSAQKMERRAQQSATRISRSYDNMGKGMAAGFKKMALPLLAGIASAKTVRAIGETTKSVARLGDEAKRAGVPLKDFQAWKFVAEQNRVGIDQMVDAFKELNLRADEFAITGKGPAAEAFARIGLGADELREKLEDPSELLLEIFKRAQRLDRAGRIRVADEIFGGTGGERFVELMAQGDLELRKTINRANELGLVLDDEIVRKADEISRRFDELTTRVANFGKRVAVAVADSVADLADLRASLDEIFADEKVGRSILGDGVYDALAKDRSAIEANKREVLDLRETYNALFREVNRVTGPTGIRVFNIDNEDAKYALADIFGAMQKTADEFERGEISADEFGDRMDELVKDAADVRDELTEIDAVAFASVISSIDGISNALITATTKAQELKNALPGAYISSGRGDGLTEAEQRRQSGNGTATDNAPTVSLRPVAAPPMIGESANTPTAGGGGGRTIDDFREAAEAIRDETVALELEAAALAAVSLVGGDMAVAIEAARREAELLHQAQLQGQAITPALRAEIRQLADEYANAAGAVDQAETSLSDFENAKEQVRSAGENAFVGLVTGAHDFKTAISQLIAELARMAASKAFASLWGGGMGNAFGGALSLFGFSDGGYTGSGGKLQPAGVVHKGEYVMPQEVVRRVGVDNLAGLHRAALRGYSDGGLVGVGKALGGHSAGRSESLASAGQVITINAPVTVEGSAGSPEQNADLAEKMARQMEGTMRGVVCDEIRRQTRPGNMLGSRK